MVDSRRSNTGDGAGTDPSSASSTSRSTSTSAFGAGRRESHDASDFYARFTPPRITDDDTVHGPLAELGDGRSFHGTATDMWQLPDNSVALVVTSPPYFVGKEYELAVASGDHDPPSSYFEFLQLLRDVFAECERVLEPGGRIAVNVANLGRKPYRSLSADVVSILQDDLGLLLRGEVIWQKGKTSSGSCAWGSFARAANPVLRDVTERVIIASKGRFDRAIKPAERARRNLPHRSTLTNDEFVDVTRDIWEIDPESATRIGHPAPFPVELPRRLIELYTYVGDVVLDPFNGAGSTLVAAARTDRIGVGYDTEAEYLELTEQRLDRERDRRVRIADAQEAPSDRASAARAALEAGERSDLDQLQAMSEGKKAQDIARRRLEEAGFTVTAKGAKLGRLGIQFDFVATNATGDRWFVDIAGAFHTARPGLQRAEVLWKTLGRIQVLLAAHPGSRVLVLTPALPKSGNDADRALRAVGPRRVFDAIELYDPAALERLAAYGAGRSAQPGFWDDADLARSSKQDASS